jgi:fucose 4-O-acetylase-like acetyltransferase
MSRGTADHKAGGTGRLDWLDALKGIGILAVVAGHVWWRGSVRDLVYAFHMPLFFIASGYMLRPVAFGALVPRLAASLVVPFFIFSALLLGADFLIEGARGMRPIFGSFAEGFRVILLETARTRGPFTILWFVPCLLLARLIWNGLAQRLGDPADWRWPAVVGALLLAGAFVPADFSPFAVQAVPGAVACLWLGALWRQRAHTLEPAAVALAVIGLALLALRFLPPINMKLGDLAIPIVSLIGAFMVTLALAAGARRLPHFPMAVLAALGRMSLVIMYVHVAVIHYLSPYVPTYVLFSAALVVSALIDWAARQAAISRRLLLGAKS